MELLPLEKLFKKQADDKTRFPNMSRDYFSIYKGLVDHFKSEIYPYIDTGLAVNSLDSGFYTAHNAMHFDEVVHYAGCLLGVESGEEKTGLSPYELYILLVAIRIHDAGNIHGRESHEKKCFSVLRNCGSLAGEDNAEKKIIADIAQAHGGKTSSGDKDTIGKLPAEQATGKNIIRPRLIASIVRFADEICENRNRAANYLLNSGRLPKQSEIFHKYASSIAANTVSKKDHRLIIDYKVPLQDLAKPWGCSLESENYLIDEILDRLDKMDRERRYCNMYSRELYTINSIRATIDIVNDEDHETIESIPVPELSDSGYPEKSKEPLKDKLKEYCGSKFYEKIISRNTDD